MPAHLTASDGPLKGQILNLEEADEWIIGRDPNEADLVIDNDEVLKKHARIFRTHEGIFIENFSSTSPLLLNGQAISEKALLKEGDRIQIGDQTLIFSEEALPKENVVQPTDQEQKKGGYDDIFGDLQKPDIPPEPAPIAAEPAEQTPPAEKEIAKTAYDTIFEDVGTPVELPIPAPPEPESPLVLKVISGPNAGAEIGLDKGRTYTIGKDPDTCDIVFQDVSVSKNHARVQISEDGIVELEDLGSKNGTQINNIPVTEKRAITSQDTVSMGTTLFLILDREDAQETIFTPKITPAPLPEPTEVAAKQAEEEKPLLKDWKSQKIPFKHLAFAASFLVIFLIMFLSFFSLFKAEHMEVAVKAPHEHIKEALAKFPGVQYSFNPASGKLFLAGHVVSAVDFQEMHYNLSLIPSIASTEDNVVIDEYVWKSMTDVLNGNANWRGTNIAAPEAGKYVVHGYVQSVDQAGLLADYLNVNFPYPDRLQNKVVVEDVLNLQIQNLLQSKGFSAVMFQLTVGDLILSGKYSEKQEKEYKELLSDLNKLEGIQSVKNFAVAALPSQASIDLTQQYKVSGSSMIDNHGYSAVINGRIFTLGQALDGMKISAIEPNSILLEKDGLKYKIDYTR